MFDSRLKHIKYTEKLKSKKTVETESPRAVAEDNPENFEEQADPIDDVNSKVIFFRLVIILVP